MKTNILKIATLSLTGLLAICSCQKQEPQAEPYSVRMVKSELVRFPDAKMLDFNTVLKWNYTHGLEIQSMIQAAELHPEISEPVWNYAMSYADSIINADGSINKYKKTNYTLDHVNPGKILFYLYDKTGEERFKIAMDTLYSQLQSHPRVSEGGFWHKKAYPYQMWLDGLYMGSPYYAQYAQRYLSGEEQAAAFADVVNQFTTVARHTYDPANGLYRHAWDESKEMDWADKTTGQAPHVWGRALGWYCMAMVDVLDFLPAGYSGRDSIISILNPLAENLLKIQDPEKGSWYQVLDQGNREGNYLETSCTAMFAYAFMKGALNGYLPKEYYQHGIKALDGINANNIQENEDGTISLTQICGVAGLGGTPYRDGSFDYYVNEIIRDNDPKGVGPYIQALLIAEKNGRELK